MAGQAPAQEARHEAAIPDPNILAPVATLGNLVGGVVLVGLGYWLVYGRGK